MLLPTACPGILNDAIRLAEERVVAANADVGASVNLRADLANQDSACLHRLPCVVLDASPLGIRIATVLARTATFFVSHDFSPRLLFSASWLRAGSFQPARARCVADVPA